MSNEKTGPDQPLKCEVVDGRIVISIGIETLKFCHNVIEQEFEPRKGYGTGFLITNADGFARDVVDELLREREDGSTVVTDLLDKGTIDASNQGSIHTEERFSWFCWLCAKGMLAAEKGHNNADGRRCCSEACAQEKNSKR